MHRRRLTIGGSATASDTGGMSTSTLRLGAVHLDVSDLDRSVAWYQHALGLRPRAHDVDVARLGAGGEDLLVLHEKPGARRAGRHAGLYHVALLFPTREDLGRAVVRLAATRTPIEGTADHGVSGAIYLPDPDGNGLELYADRPRAAWPAPQPGSRVGMVTAPLDVDALVAPLADEEPAPHAAEGLVVGHLHLHVGDLARGLAFYRDVLGLELMAELPRAAFVAADGYHHHLGFNTWRGEGVGPAPADAVGLRRWTIVLADGSRVDAVRAQVASAGLAADDADGGFVVRDPWENALHVRSEA